MPTNNLTQQQVTEAVRRHFGDLGEDVVSTLSAIIMAESGGRVDAVGDNFESGYQSEHSPARWDRGLAQINSQHNYDAARLISDVDYNLNAAREIYDSQGFDAWTTYRSGAYQQFVEAPVTNGETDTGVPVTGGSGSQTIPPDVDIEVLKTLLDQPATPEGAIQILASDFANFQFIVTSPGPDGLPMTTTIGPPSFLSVIYTEDDTEGLWDLLTELARARPDWTNRQLVKEAVGHIEDRAGNIAATEEAGRAADEQSAINKFNPPAGTTPPTTVTPTTPTAPLTPAVDIEIPPHVPKSVADFIRTMVASGIDPETGKPIIGAEVTLAYVGDDDFVLLGPGGPGDISRFLFNDEGIIWPGDEESAQVLEQAQIDLLNAQANEIAASLHPDWIDVSDTFGEGRVQLAGTSTVLNASAVIESGPSGYIEVEGIDNAFYNPVTGDFVDRDSNVLERDKFSFEKNVLFPETKREFEVTNRRLALDAALENQLGLEELLSGQAVSKVEQPRLGQAAGGELAATLQTLRDARTNAAIALSADPGDFVAREFAVRAMQPPDPARESPLFEEPTTLENIIQQLIATPEPEFRDTSTLQGLIDKILEPVEAPPPAAIPTIPPTVSTQPVGAPATTATTVPTTQGQAPPVTAQAADPRTLFASNPLPSEVDNTVPGGGTTTPVAPSITEQIAAAGRMMAEPSFSSLDRDSQQRIEDLAEGYVDGAYVASPTTKLNPLIGTSYKDPSIAEQIQAANDMLKQPAFGSLDRDSQQRIRGLADVTFPVAGPPTGDSTLGGEGGLKGGEPPIDFGDPSNWMNLAQGGRTLENMMIVGDPQTPGKPNPEVVIDHDDGSIEVIPLNKIPRHAFGTFESHTDKTMQQLPLLQHIQGRAPASQFRTLATGSSPGAFGTELPEAGSVNFRRLVDILRDPVASAMFDSLLRSGSRSLEGLTARTALRAPIGTAQRASLIRT